MRSSPKRIILPVLLVVTDLLALNAAYLTALYLRFHAYDLLHWARAFGIPYLHLLVATNVIYFLLLLYYKEYLFPRRFKPTFVVPRIAKIVLITTLASVMIIFLSRGIAQNRRAFHFSRPTLIAFWILCVGYISLARLLFGYIQLAVFRRGFLQRPVFLVGGGAPMKDLTTRLAFNRWFGVTVLGRFRVGSGAPPPEEGIEVLPDGAALAGRIREKNVREILLAAPPGDLSQIFAVTEAAKETGCVLRMIPGQLQLVISHLLLSEKIPAENRTKEDLVYELMQRVDARFELELATVAIIGAKGIPATFGGIERHVAELTGRLARQGFVVKVYSRPYYTTLEGRFQGVEVLRLPTIHTKHLDAITHTFIATLHTLMQRVDLAHFHAQGPSVFSFLPRLFGVRTVVTVHGLDWMRDKWGSFASRCLQMGESASARYPNRTVTVSRTLKRYYEQKYGREVTYIPNGIDLKEIPAPRVIEEEFGLAPRSYILFVGRLVPEKGCHYLIDAFRRLQTDLALVIAGGSSHSDEYVNQLKESAGGDERIRFLGYVYGDSLSALYAHSYLYVHPSDLEGLSIALLEALSFGCAALVSDIDENLEVLTDEETPAETWEDPSGQAGPPVGFRFRRGDRDDLLRRLAERISDPEGTEKMRGKTREWIRRRYDWDVVAEQTAALYRTIAKK